MKLEELVQVSAAVAGTSGRLTVASALQHGAIHAVHHRGQVALLLRVPGYAPGNFEMLFYFEEKQTLRAASTI